MSLKERREIGRSEGREGERKNERVEGRKRGRKEGRERVFFFLFFKGTISIFGNLYTVFKSKQKNGKRSKTAW